MENILVVKLSAIGDVIHALPVSYVIKEQYPNAHLTWVVEPTAYAILEDNPYIDELILFEKAKFRSIGGFLHEIGPFRKRLRVRHYDASLDLQGLFKSAAIVWNAGAKLRIGTANMREGAHLVSRPVRGAHASGHIVERYLDVARALGCAVREVRFPVAVSARDRMAAETLLAREGVAEGRTFVAFAIGANWPNKRWPVEHFGALADRLYHAHYVPVLVGGGRLLTGVPGVDSSLSDTGLGEVPGLHQGSDIAQRAVLQWALRKSRAAADIHGPGRADTAGGVEDATPARPLTRRTHDNVAGQSIKKRVVDLPRL